MMEASIAYDQIMKMPYAAFLGVIKHIRMTQLMQNPDWREGYLQWQLKDSYTNGTIKKQTSLDLQGLMSLQASLK